MSTATINEKSKTAATAAKPRLILTHGEKGGVGKTTVARLVADFLASRDAAFRAFDAEGAAGQLLRFHPAQTSAVEVDKAAAIAPVLDYLMDGNGKRLALVDLGARSGEDLKDWLYKGGALEEAEAGELGITVIYVVGGAVDSVGHLKECYAALGSEVEYVIVKNFGVAAKFDVYEGSNTRKDLLAAGAKEISIPALDGTVYQSVDKASVAFSAFCDGQGTDAGYTEKRYCRTWLRECFAALDEVAGLLQ
ncbi:MAG: hypothetical protein JNM66_21965 [Bryobacterales bacterium]|nr:hypothetical protein [Bryobacterales bacterium]